MIAAGPDQPFSGIIRLKPGGLAWAAADVAVMPSGALGLWYMDEYTASPLRMVPNSVSAGGRTNLLSAPRRLFNNAAVNVWSPRTSFADTSLADPYGTNDASLLTGVSNFSAGPNGGVTLTAGTYTIAHRTKRSGGTDQSFKMAFDTAPVQVSATKTAASSWQWFTHTATIAAGTHTLAFIKSFDGATGATVETIDWMLLPGTVTADVDLEAAAAACQIGDMQLSTAASYSSGAVDFAGSTRLGLAQFPTQTITNFTAFALVSKTLAGSAYQSFLNKAQDYTHLGAFVEESGATQGYFGGTTLGTSKRQVTLLNQGYHLLTFRHDGTKLSYFLDDCLLDQKAVSASSRTIQDLFSGLVAAASLYMGAKLAGAVGFYSRALTDAEVRTVYTVQKARAALSGITPVRCKILAADGDSITEAAAGYFYKFLPNASPMVQGRNYAVSGAGLAEVQSRASTIDAMLPPSPEAGKFILSLFVGANLPVGSDMPTFLSDYAAYCDARRAAGWKVAVVTILPRISDVSDSFNSRRSTINAAIATWVGVHCDAIVDFAADPTMGPNSAANGVSTYNATYYADGVHPTNAGHVILETVYRAVINSLYP